MRFSGESLDQLRAVAGETANFILLSVPSRDSPLLDRAAICCLLCGMTSFNENDVRECYCGNCHQFFAFLPSWKEAKTDA